MNILFLGLALFFIALIFHVAVWRMAHPERGIKTLLEIFIIALIMGIIALRVFSMTWPEIFHICLFFISLALAYTVTYTAVEADSPTLLILNEISRCGQTGLAANKLEQLMSDEVLIKPRINDLISDKMVYLAGEKYRLTSKVAFIIRIFIFYRKLFGLERGG